MWPSWCWVSRAQDHNAWLRRTCALNFAHNSEETLILIKKKKKNSRRLYPNNVEFLGFLCVFRGFCWLILIYMLLDCVIYDYYDYDSLSLGNHKNMLEHYFLLLSNMTGWLMKMCFIETHWIVFIYRNVNKLWIKC